VALAGNQDDIARTGGTDGRADRLGPVLDFLGRRPLGQTRGHLAENDGRLLAPRVVGSEDDAIGQLGRRGRHLGTLPLVAVAAGADHDPKRSTGDRFQRAEGRLDGIGGMGVVDQHGEFAGSGNGFHPAGHRGRAAQGGRHFFRRNSGGDGGSRSTQRVGNVESSQPWQRRGKFTLGSDQAEGGSLDAHLQVGHADIPFLQTVTEDANARSAGRGHADATRIIQIDRGKSTGAKTAKEKRLGLFVGLHRSVVVEMVAAEIGEDGPRKFNFRGAPLVERVGTDLQGGGAAAVLPHLRQQLLEIERLGRGVAGGHAAAAGVVGDRAKQTAPKPASLEERLK